MRNQLIEKLKASKKHLETSLQKLSANFSKQNPESPTKEPKMDLEKPLSMAYQLMGDKTARFMPLFKDLDQNLQKSGLRVNFKAYVSLTILISFLITLPVAVVLPVLLFFVFKVPLGSALLFGVRRRLVHVGAFGCWFLLVPRLLRG